MDLIDRRFNWLTVIGLESIHTSPCGRKQRMWLCRCDCGNTCIVSESNLKNGSTKSCGCWKSKRLKQYNMIHNGTNDRLYKIWKSMKRRCNNKNDSHFKYYGGKGISVCKEWDKYEPFKKWAYLNGYNEDSEFGECTLDRINNSGNYEPSNCRWANRVTQANNTNRNHIVSLNGHKMTIAEFARILNIDKNHAWYYINKFEKEISK